jgi:CBS domain-containing protein
MLVKEIMTRDVECIRPDAILEEAARKMRDLDVGALPVCNDDDQPVGVVTDRDITVRAVAAGKDPRATHVRQIMTPSIIYCFDEEDITDAVRLMEEKQVRRLAVLNRNGRLVGIVSLGDVAIDTHDERLAGEALEAVSEPVGAGR